MRLGVLGTGVVGQTLGSRLVGLGHEVMMGSRSAGSERAAAWAAAAGEGASEGTFADAARFGAIVVNATAGEASLAALEAAGADSLAGKVLLDVSNPLLSSSGFPFTLSVCNTDSVGEQIQRAFPAARVVKSLNTVAAQVMVEPARVPGSHAVFVSGDDAPAKDEVAGLLTTFGWPPGDIVDLGGISTARGTEMYLALWMRLMTALGTPHFNIEIRRA